MTSLLRYPRILPNLYLSANLIREAAASPKNLGRRCSLLREFPV
nr:MAG TPA: hypothetical protein [Caudoviricetes sp.]